MTPRPDATVPVPLRTALQLCSIAGRRGLALHLLLVVAQGALPLAGLFAMQWLVDAVADGALARVTPAVAWRSAALAIGLAAGVAFAGNVLRALSAVVGENQGRRLADASAKQLQEHTARLELAAFDRSSFHDLLHRASAEAGGRPVRLVQDLAAFSSAAVSLVLMASLLATVEPWLPLLAGGAAAPIAWTRRRHARLRLRWQEHATGQQREVGYLGAVLTGRASAKDVRALNLLPALGERLDRLRTHLRDSLRQLTAGRARDELLVHTLAAAALFGSYLYLGDRALAGALSIGGLVLQAQAVQRAQNGVRDLLGAWSGIHEDRLFLRPLVDFLALPEQPAAASPVVELPPGGLAIDARDLGFTYPEAPHAALSHITVHVAAGERIAIVGPNGSGKSTLVKLLCRVYDPTIGELRAAGVDLRHVDCERWRARVACLFQDAQAFELTLGENLALGHRGPPDERALWRALEVVGLAARVRALPLGLATPLSRRIEGGVEWSGGELRRLLLARALAQPADLLVLDEPFALLDGVAAKALAEELAAGDRRRTVIVVDHRAAAARWVDRVLMLDRGRLVATGPPAEIAAREPQFRALFPDW